MSVSGWLCLCRWLAGVAVYWVVVEERDELDFGGMLMCVSYASVLGRCVERVLMLMGLD